MENATRWIFCLVMTALLMYACAVFRSTSVQLSEAREELTALRVTERALREENETLSRKLAAEKIGSG